MLLTEIVENMNEDANVVMKELESSPVPLSPQDKQLLETLNSAAPQALIDSLDKNGVTEVDVDLSNAGTPMERVSTMLSESYALHSEKGFSTPDLGNYRVAGIEMHNNNALWQGRVDTEHEGHAKEEEEFMQNVEPPEGAFGKMETYCNPETGQTTEGFPNRGGLKLEYGPCYEYDEGHEQNHSIDDGYEPDVY